jgi:predicted Rossmann fold flavoprotein
MSSAQAFDVVVLGAGAAGLMCAVEAGKRGRRVVVIERADRIGKKILISGGGRCNFTNIYCEPSNFISANPHFAKSALARYTPADFIALVEKHRIPYHEKTLGQLFCDRHASDIVNMLEAECRSAGVQIVTKTNLQEVTRGTEFSIRTDRGVFTSSALVVATGGLSIPKMGATAFGYELARQFGVAVRECQPALVPLTLSVEDRRKYCDLAGISMEVVASANGAQFGEKMLITHRGLSGPAILQISSYWKKHSPIHLDLAPGREVFLKLREQNTHRNVNARSELRAVLPARFADRWLDLHGPNQWTNAGLAELESRLHNWEIMPDGTEGYDKAEVTAGGVDTSELSAKSMDSRRVPGLFFIGEAVDVTGHLGGFNFQWAWASGAAAGREFASRK